MGSLLCCGIGIGSKANYGMRTRGLTRTFDVEHKGCLQFYVLF